MSTELPHTLATRLYPFEKIDTFNGGQKTRSFRASFLFFCSTTIWAELQKSLASLPSVLENYK